MNLRQLDPKYFGRQDDPSTSFAEEDVLMLFPALTLTRETARRGLDLFEQAL